MRSTVLVGLFYTAVTSVAAQLYPSHQMTFSGGDANAYSAFLSHFSAKQASGSASLIDHLRSLHPNSAFVATQARDFDFHSFAQAPQNKATIRKVAASQQLIPVTFVPPERRLDGLGKLGEHPVFGSYDLDFENSTFRIYHAEWMEGFNQYHQDHVVGDTEEAIKALILTVSTFANSLNEVILVYDQSEWTPSRSLWQSVQKASWDDVILNDDLKKAVQHDYRSFFKSSKLYKDLGVPWKRGSIYLGPPGNGKTISLKAIMKDAGVPSLYVKSFHSYGGDELGIRLIFERARREAPCILILEDLDSLITDENRSFFLNEVDGLEDNDGLLLIGSTNHFDKLDPALSNRPSRFDRKFNFPEPDKAERRQYAVYWQDKLSKNKNVEFPDTLLDEAAEATKGFSFAYLKEAFVAALITLAADESGSPPSFSDTLLHQIELLKEQLDKGDDNAFFPQLPPHPEGISSGGMGRGRGRAMRATRRVVV